MQRVFFFGWKIPLLLLFLFAYTATPVKAKEEPDSATLAMKKRSNKIALQSALLPGLGQASNHKYWKIPIIYAGFGALVYFIDFNNTNYRKYKTALLYRSDNDSLTVDGFPNFTPMKI